MLGDLTPDQADGLAYVVCGGSYLTSRARDVPVGVSHTGSQVFACAGHCRRPGQGGRVVTRLPEFGPPAERVLQMCGECGVYTSRDRDENHYGPADYDGLICRECCTLTGTGEW
ncbi:hypothetical protein [Jiangella gansuensis]|uniref:hypothetical protein n=1 Tax=Jiangella gansuensis TaxID=281473 RepID=UPI0004B0EF35|nr:hypothetical protein [Jiangella gansuensis]